MYALCGARVFGDSVGPQAEEGSDVLAIGVHDGFSSEDSIADSSVRSAQNRLD